jgi:Protein of unknown function (DUF3485)
MRNQKILLVVGLLMIGSTAYVLGYLKANQKLGEPGVKTGPSVAGGKLDVLLPELVPGYTSQWRDQSDVTVSTLPKDTSYGQRLYTSTSDGFQVLVNVVLMGSDRTSIHKPQYCLTGAGYNIDNAASGRESIPMDRPQSYDLPVMKIVATKGYVENGKPAKQRAVYVYWYVADGILSGDPSGIERMWSMASELLKTGVLQRWAYVSYLAVCLPGQEAETFERIKKLIQASVPEFQLTPEPPEQAATKR